MNIHTPVYPPFTSQQARDAQARYERRRKILDDYETPGASLSSVARKYGVTKARIQQILRHAKRERDLVPAGDA